MCLSEVPLGWFNKNHLLYRWCTIVCLSGALMEWHWMYCFSFFVKGPKRVVKNVCGFVYLQYFFFFTVNNYNQNYTRVGLEDKYFKFTLFKCISFFLKLKLVSMCFASGGVAFLFHIQTLQNTVSIIFTHEGHEPYTPVAHVRWAFDLTWLQRGLKTWQRSTEMIVWYSNLSKANYMYEWLLIFY